MRMRTVITIYTFLFAVLIETTVTNWQARVGLLTNIKKCGEILEDYCEKIASLTKAAAPLGQRET